jgi:hypothetical protein
MDVFVNWTEFFVRSRFLAWVITIVVTVPVLLMFGPLISHIYEEYIGEQRPSK